MGVKALERLEDPLLQLRRDPGSVVADPECHRSRLRLNLDGDNAPLGAVPHGVGQQVHEDLLEPNGVGAERSEEHTSELQSRLHLVCRLLLEKKKKKNKSTKSCQKAM